MRIAVISDTHFGDDLCTLVRAAPDGGPPGPGPAYAALRRAVGRVDYLVHQLKQGALPHPFKRAVPGVIDAREPRPRLRLPDVAAHPEWHSARTDYGGLFLDHITLGPAEGPHERSGGLSVRELVGVNFPLHQLACSGIGQAQPLTTLARRLQLDLSAGRTDRVARYLERLEAVLTSRSVPVLTRLARRWFARRARALIVAALAEAEQTRYSRSFLSRAPVRERFHRYFRSCLAELDRLRREHGHDLPPPDHVVFGHTHQPIPWGSDELADSVDGHEVRFCNTGGWLLRKGRDGRLEFDGAEVVVYETGRGVRSIAVAAGDLELELG